MLTRLIANALMVLAAVLCMAGCATPKAPVEPPDALLRDDAFAARPPVLGAAEIFALSPAMRSHLDNDLSGPMRRYGRQRGLIEALYDRRQIQLEYDAALTRTAAQAFDARSGNCLSLVIMTAALARHLELPVIFQSVEVDDAWSRGQGLLLAAGHVNLVLSERPVDRARGLGVSNAMTVDFLPPDDVRGRRTSVIDESRIVAMFMNNRAAETLAQGDLDGAYAWARAAALQDPGFQSATITLGVIYHRRGLLPSAEAAFRHALRREPGNTQALADLAAVLKDQGRGPEAEQVRQTLVRLESVAPFHYFDLGRAAVQRGDNEAGRVWLQRELRRDPDYHETHYWLGLAYRGLGDLPAAQRHLSLAMTNSTNRGDHDLYAAKLDRLQALKRP